QLAVGAEDEQIHGRVFPDVTGAMLIEARAAVEVDQQGRRLAHREVEHDAMRRRFAANLLGWRRVENLELVLELVPRRHLDDDIAATELLAATDQQTLGDDPVGDDVLGRLVAVDVLGDPAMDLDGGASDAGFLELAAVRSAMALLRIAGIFHLI